LNDIIKTKNTLLIKAKAKELGFDRVGISKAEFLQEEAPRLEKWLKESRHGNMAYMEHHFDKRLDPTLLVDDAKSVISFSLNYYPQEHQNEDSYKISKYAYGQDYHLVIKEKLKTLLSFISQNIGEVNGRGFVDSAPVMDKAWAKKSGIGWLGKNNNLITKKSGSFFFIAELILDLELDTDNPTSDHCGTCTKCIDACPTEAIYEDHKVDGSKCISYLTIELKDSLIPNNFSNQMEDWMFGCDICQDVCPWNKFSTPTKEAAFTANPKILENTKSDWEEITQEIFSEIFRKNPVKRTKFEGLRRNIKFISNKSK
jgi:epoxyqueuosine reductase